jgi:peptidoglycan/LPS O-acetylase OafA/YrhL
MGVLMAKSIAAVLDVEATRARTDALYRPGLDLLRAVAFLLVFVAHGLMSELNQATQIGALARTGEFGVAIFFFLSSYLITELLLREKRDIGTVLIPQFYARRILRIWPLYFSVIGVGWFYGHFSASHTLSLAWVASLVLLCTNWYTAGHGFPPGFLFPLWSISLEEQFYLAWPLLVKYLSPAALFGVASLLMSASYLTLAILLDHGRNLDPAIFVNSLVQFQFFALGSMTALVLRGRIPKVGKSLRWAMLAAGLLCLRAAQSAVFADDPTTPHDFTHIAPCYLAALAGCLCLFFCFLQLGTGRLMKPFLYLGKISYGLYVYHVLWLGLARDLLLRLAGTRMSAIEFQLTAMAIALPATIVTAMISYRYLETPFLKLKKRFTVVASRPV